MAVTIVCPRCGNAGPAPAGRVVRCPRCATRIATPPDDQVVATARLDRTPRPSRVGGRAVPPPQAALTRALLIAAVAGGLLMGGCLLSLAYRENHVPDPDDAPESANVWGVRVEIDRVAVTQVSAPAGDEEVISDGPVLLLRLRLKGVGPDTRVRYRSWVGDGLVQLLDDRHVAYAQVRMRDGRGREFGVPGQVQGTAFVNPGQEVRDTLLFQKPQATARCLLLRLPKANIEGSGYLWLRIPRERFAGR
jgi:hypothetical protein